MTTIWKEGKTVEAAIEAACEELGVTRQDLEIEVISEGSTGLLGMLAKKAKIRASFKPYYAMPGQNKPGETASPDGGPEEGADKKRKYFNDIDKPARQKIDIDPREVLEKISKMIYEEAYVEKFNREENVLLRIVADGSGIFIGKKGATLDALQYIVNKIMGQAGHTDVKVVVDSEDYRVRKSNKLHDMALALGAKAKSLGRRVSTEPLNAYDRRIVHLALKDDPEVETKSTGVGELKRVHIQLVGK